MLWSRAFFSRLLRRRGLVKEAEEQEEWIHKKARDLPAGLGGELPTYLLDDGEQTNFIVECIGRDYFSSPELRFPDGTVLVFPANGVVIRAVCT